MTADTLERLAKRSIHRPSETDPGCFCPGNDDPCSKLSHYWVTLQELADLVRPGGVPQPETPLKYPDGPCETPDCQHRCCACGHIECSHANENVQPNCADCDCACFTVAARVNPIPGATIVLDMERIEFHLRAVNVDRESKDFIRKLLREVKRLSAERENFGPHDSLERCLNHPNATHELICAACQRETTPALATPLKRYTWDDVQRYPGSQEWVMDEDVESLEITIRELREQQKSDYDRAEKAERDAEDASLREMQHAPRPDCQAEGWHLCVPIARPGGVETPPASQSQLLDVLNDLQSCVENIECDCVDPPEDDNPNYDAHAQYCRVYLDGYIDKLKIEARGAVEPPPTEGQIREGLYAAARSARSTPPPATPKDAWLIRDPKDQYWWRENRCGYTSHVYDAGFYTEDEAKSIERGKRGDKAVPITDKYVQEEIATLLAFVERLRGSTPPLERPQETK